MGKAYIYCFGETPQNILNPNEWQDIFFEFNGLVKNITKNEQNNEFTCVKAGHYLINMFCNMQKYDDDNIPIDVSLRLIFNNAYSYDVEISGGQRSIHLSDPNTLIQLGMQVIYDLNPGDKIKFQVASSGNAKIWTNGIGVQPDNVGLIIQKI
jgi:hypothetical protein